MEWYTNSGEEQRIIYKSICVYRKENFLKGKKLFQNIMSFWKAINTTIALSTVVVTEVVKTTTKVTIPKFFLKIIYCSDWSS